MNGHRSRTSAIGRRLTARLSPSRHICLRRWMARRPQEIAVEFLRWVRDERKFENAEALKAQIHAGRESRANVFSQAGPGCAGALTARMRENLDMEEAGS